MIPIVKVSFPPKEVLMPVLEAVLYSGQVAEGQYVYDFEEKFAKHFNMPNVLGMSSGTAALHAALVLAGVGAGDEVISTPMTAEPTNTSILYCGAKVVWADVDPLSGNIDPESVRVNITSKTKAIVAVHYAGYPVRLAELRAIADEYGIALIEDCAHALGATYAGKGIGAIGDFGLFSFQAIKHMTTIDGGVLSIADEKHITAAKKFRWFGMLKGVPRTEVDIQSIGYKYNMSNVTGAIGLVQLDHINSILDKHKSNGHYYDQQFSSIAGIDFARCDPQAGPSYWLYTLLSDHSTDIEKALNEAGVAASKLHKPNNLHTIFSDSKKPLPGLDAFYKRLLHIPCGWWVSDEERERIVDIIKRG
ncbi:DegT/DnrJ/EryC1/StrS family aminotransferase [Undibacterium oligocarboniphilum]|uniref:DegT/DnrJ/EryC1/StrS family aminotransferase n=1 Tax=Undibacterium oligocarboniphilum TaxID=666702 RepID=A0A850QLB1_9BURK|nr:DegT/DnrJ/EryC1/StrS family aminotransferase [Undibacterium oligocarboniphilum]MBC3868956.1 DegT/DnrJ/EryC1/StrS family aminotransferase [Undibacterium oligocarboniphilum]NVO76936.1 DegT/DnrJ/EryC1/StrS family aminotransferase [Undibacterium oligocarboniphilum]